MHKTYKQLWLILPTVAWNKHCASAFLLIFFADDKGVRARTPSVQNITCVPLPRRHDGILIFPHADVLRDVGIVVTWHSRGRVIGLADGEEEGGVVTSS